MLSDKEIKKKFLEITAKEPDKFYPTKSLKKKGFKRFKCEKCGRYFWSIKHTKVCGDSSCTGGFSFIGNSPAKNKLDYVGVWKTFAKIMNKYGYQEVKRYPVVARWNPTTEFTIASIAAFQPYVVSGEIAPPAQKLVIPQFCLRFNDIDNVGITGAHYTGFIMMGQHAFVPPKDYDIENYFEHIYEWIIEGIGIPPEELKFHEDFWAGGGNFGPCMEFFSRGLEIGNQVYMQYEQVDEKIDKRGYRELGIKVLDMGEGQERAAWFSQGTLTSYETTFPTVLNMIKKKIKFELDSKQEEILKKYIPFSALMNIDDIEQQLLTYGENVGERRVGEMGGEKNYIDILLEIIAKEIKIPKEKLKEIILPLSAIYSIAEHSRALLFAISDGALPSNSGGGYNLRNIFRRAQSFIEKYGWDKKGVSISELCEEHAKYLKPIFPELSENITEVKEITNNELKKFSENKEKAKRIIERIATSEEKHKRISVEKLILLYDSDGIDPYFLKDELKKVGINVSVPDDFYKLISEMHEKRELDIKKKDEEKKQKTQTKRELGFGSVDISDIENTKILYYDNYLLTDFTGQILKVFEIDEKSALVLDQTAFYPTSGGQLHDIGTFALKEDAKKTTNIVNVVDIIKKDGKIIHLIDKKVGWKIGESVKGKIDVDRRLQLAQHHTATHIINGVAKKLLGSHIWQSGASKTTEKARLDITHYESLSDKQLRKIEELSNEMINLNLPVNSKIMKKNLAELEYGMRIYQGGAIPGKDLRIIEIPDLDVEACGGTHVKQTSEIESIKILKSTKIQDGVVRIEFVAGEAAMKEQGKNFEIVAHLIKLFKTNDEKILKERLIELFGLWKKLRKAEKKNKKEEVNELNKRLRLIVDSKYNFEDLKIKEATKIAEKIKDPKNLVEELAKSINSQPTHLINTIKRFIKK